MQVCDGACSLQVMHQYGSAKFGYLIILFHCVFLQMPLTNLFVLLIFVLVTMHVPLSPNLSILFWYWKCLA